MTSTKTKLYKSCRAASIKLRIKFIGGIYAQEIHKIFHRTKISVHLNKTLYKCSCIYYIYNKTIYKILGILLNITSIVLDISLKSMKKI